MKVEASPYLRTASRLSPAFNGAPHPAEALGATLRVRGTMKNVTRVSASRSARDPIARQSNDPAAQFRSSPSAFPAPEYRQQLVSYALRERFFRKLARKAYHAAHLLPVFPAPAARY